MALARYPYHSGRSADLLATVTNLRRRFPESPLYVVGFSMGGNILLKLLGELGAASQAENLVTRAVAVCPPIDLAYTVDHLRNGLARWYDHYFARVCVEDVRRRKQCVLMRSFLTAGSRDRLKPCGNLTRRSPPRFAVLQALPITIADPALSSFCPTIKIPDAGHCRSGRSGRSI